MLCKERLIAKIIQNDTRPRNDLLWNGILVKVWNEP